MTAELWRLVHSPRTWAALAVGVFLSLIGFQQYASLNFRYQEPSAWVAMGYATEFLSPFFPVVGAIALGDWIAADMESGYWAYVVVRSNLWRTLWRRTGAALCGVMAIMIVTLMPTAVLAVLYFPLVPGLMAGAVRAYPGPEWSFILANAGTLTLAAASWTTVAMLGVPFALPRRYWAVAGSIVAYLVASAVLPLGVNPMRRSDLWFYQPPLGPFWTDAVLWAGFLPVGVIMFIGLTMRKGDILGGANH